MIKIKTRSEYPIIKRLKQKIVNVRREMLNLEKINLCCYSVDNTTPQPFLKYLLYKDNNEMFLPWISNLSNKKNLITYSETTVKQLFKNNNVETNYKGYIYDNNKEMYIFFEISNINNYVNSLQSDLLIFTTIHEIVNERKVFTYSISNKVYSFFIENPDILYLYDNEMNIHEIPTVMYYGSEKEKSKFNIIFGVSKSYIYALFGAHYYFSNLGGALRFAGWHSISSNALINNTEYYSNVKTGKFKKGTVLRNVIFLGNTLIKPNNKKDTSGITRSLLQNKKILNDSLYISDRGGDWVHNYNSIIYNKVKSVNGLILAIKNIDNVKLLSIHDVDLTKFPEKINNNLDLVELI